MIKKLLLSRDKKKLRGKRYGKRKVRTEIDL